MITKDLFEEFPNFIDFIVKIEEKKSEEKNIERQIKFIEEQQKLEIELNLEKSNCNMKINLDKNKSGVKSNVKRKIEN
jgi:hypothetical protein